MAELNSISALLTDVNLENYYRLSDLSDSSPKGRTLTQTGTVSFATAKYGNGAIADFNGNNRLTAPTFNPGTGAVSLGCWFKKNGVPTVNYDPSYLMIGNTNRLYLIANKDTGYAKISIYDGAFTLIDTTVNICDNKLHLIIGTRTGTTHKLYIDGIEVGSTTGTARNINTTTLYIGNDDAVNDYIGNATIDDVLVYSRALTAAEVLQLYKDQSSGFFALLGGL